ncbi:Spy/CpxP family protein refolding chaperone [Alsobacter sp. R-9]
MSTLSNRMDRTVLTAAGLALVLAAGGVAYAAENRGVEGGLQQTQWREGRGGGDRGDRMGGMDGMGGMMGGPMMMGGRLCNASESFVPRMTQRLERSVTLTDAQKPDFEALKAAMTKAESTLKAACPTEAERNDRTPTGRLALAEKRMTAALDAIRTVRPAFDAFYAKLDDKQRDQMRWSTRGGAGGHMMDGHRHRWN